MKPVVLTSGKISSFLIIMPPMTISSISSGASTEVPRIGAVTGLATSTDLATWGAGVSTAGFSPRVKASTSGKWGALSCFSAALGVSTTGGSMGFSTGLGVLSAGVSTGFSTGCTGCWAAGALGVSSLGLGASSLGLGGWAGGGVVIITGSSFLVVSFGFSGCGLGFSGCGLGFCLGIVSSMELAYFSMISLR